jgi:Serine aminopeptidase, S33
VAISPRRRLTAALLVLVAISVGCGSDESVTPSIDARIAVDADGRRLALRCWGDGTPTVVLDAGSGIAGIAEFEDLPVVEELSARTRVCSYDRAGLGASDPAPVVRPRGLDDAVGDLRTLLEAAKLRGPFVLVGASGGGYVAYHFAGRHPREVVGLVLLDVPAPNASIPAGTFATWNSAGNHERADYAGIQRQLALNRLPIPAIPVTVITASSGISAHDPSEQRLWLEGSSHPEHVVLDGGHAIHADAASDVLAEVNAVLDRARPNTSRRRSRRSGRPPPRAARSGAAAAARRRRASRGRSSR